MKEHWEPVEVDVYSDIESGRERILLREAAGNYRAGDKVRLRERHHTGALTGRESFYTVTDVREAGQAPSYLSVSKLVNGKVRVTIAPVQSAAGA